LANRTGPPCLPPRRGRAGGGPLSAGPVDSHCHLQNEAFDADRDAVIDRAVAAGIERILVPGYDLASSEAALELASRRPGLITAGVGIHPHFAAAATESEWERLEAMAGERDTVAIGEIGLDYFRNLSPPEVQRDAFARQLDLAARAGKPVLVHDRDAHAEISAALLGWAGPNRAVRGVLHCFSGDAPMALALAAAGYLVSFALPVAFHSAIGPRAAASALPVGSILAETDSPWLAPGSDRRNEPTTVLRVLAELARLRGSTPVALAEQVAAAYERLLAA
jgi:TatD DNase family protein